jgi:CheY-like chemotaxis protein
MARILIIDDDPAIRFYMRDVLEGAGYDIVEAADGAQGLRAQDADPAALVLCDIFMDRMDGYQTICRLRLRHPTTPIIAMSAGSTVVPGTGYLQMAQHLGAIAVLQKPEDLAPSRLLQAVAAALGQA